MSEDGIGWYLQQASRYPLLTPSEEISLGNDVQEYMKLREIEKPTLKEKRLILQVIIKQPKTKHVKILFLSNVTH